MVAFDTEARSTYVGEDEVQEWRVGCAIRWRTDLRTGTHAESRVFPSPLEFWTWVSEFTRSGTRTVVWAHNLGYDVRVSRMFEILPLLGFRLEWCNLDRNISSATWRSDHGTIVLADTWTWIPLPLSVIATHMGMVKYEMPANRASDTEWARYCMQDCAILHHVVCDLVRFISTSGLGNWQPTGAGMAMATWRHRFMSCKVLVHDDTNALAAERLAMHTGRAEAWKHGKIHGEKWTELDITNAYVSAAAQYDLPRKIHMRTGAITVSQFRKLCDTFQVLCHVTVSTDVPSVPCKFPDRHAWPVGTFDTWLWDCEVSLAIKYGGKVKIHDSYTYIRAPVLQDWANWVLGILSDQTGSISPVVRTHVKHCGRSLIGRLALRAPHWEHWGDNPEGITGITHVFLPGNPLPSRMLHVGNDTLVETGRTEGKDSLPMITGRIMSEVRCILWDAMNAVGTDNLAHVDTDSILCRTSSISNLQSAYDHRFDSVWHVKGTYTDLEIWSPRAYWRDKQRVAAGIPAKGDESDRGTVTGVRWSALAGDLERGTTGTVTLSPGTWHMRRTDPRRADACEGPGDTRAYDAAEIYSANGSSSDTMSSGS